MVSLPVVASPYGISNHHLHLYNFDISDNKGTVLIEWLKKERSNCAYNNGDLMIEKYLALRARTRVALAPEKKQETKKNVVKHSCAVPVVAHRCYMVSGGWIDGARDIARMLSSVELCNKQ